MPNSIKYSVSTLSKALKKGNFYIGTNDVGKGSDYYNGITPPAGGYTIYLNKASQGPSIYVAANDATLITITNKIAGTIYTTAEECLAWFAQQTDKMVLNKDKPSIVTDSLSLYLDPESVSSYPRSGTRWFDLINNLQFDSYGSQTTFTTLGGAKAFSFNGSGYWMSNSSATQVDMAGDCTLIMWIYNTDFPHSDRKTIFQKNGTVYQSYEQEIAVTWEVNPGLSWYSRVTDYDYGSTPTVNSGWTMMGIKMSSGKTTAVRSGYYSVNGAAWYQNYYPRSTNPITTAGNVVIGSGYAGTVSQGAIGMVLCYNKMLSDAEVLQNFNATRSTYGI